MVRYVILNVNRDSMPMVVVFVLRIVSLDPELTSGFPVPRKVLAGVPVKFCNALPELFPMRPGVPLVFVIQNAGMATTALDRCAGRIARTI